MYGHGVVEVLTGKTLKEFNVDVLTTNPGSHKKIYVKCTRCKEEFTREFRHVLQLHACPTRIVRDDGLELKWCNSCEAFLTLGIFEKNAARYDGLSSACSACIRTKPKAKSDTAKKVLKRKTDFKSWIKASISKKKNACKHHGIDFNIDEQYLLDRWELQDGKCAYFKIPLVFATAKALNGATLERIDSSLGYVKGNVIFASRMANLGKNDSLAKDFNDILTEVVYRLSSADLPRIEVVVRHKDAIIPTRKRTSDAGYDLYSMCDADISPGEVVDINTGISFIAPHGFFFTVEGRSSMYKSGVVPFRGIIDAGYSGDMIVSLMNVGKSIYFIKKGERIAQLIPHKMIPIDLMQVHNVSSDYNIRGTAGFGSSGK